MVSIAYAADIAAFEQIVEAYAKHPKEVHGLAESIAQRNNAALLVNLRERSFPDFKYNLTGEPRRLHDKQRLSFFDKLKELAIEEKKRQRTLAYNKRRGG